MQSCMNFLSSVRLPVNSLGGFILTSRGPMLVPVESFSVMSSWKLLNRFSVSVGETICKSLKALYKLSRESSVFGVVDSEFVLFESVDANKDVGVVREKA